MTRCIRYFSDNSTATTYGFSVDDFMQFIGYATSSTAGDSLVQSFRIKRVKVIAMPDTSDVSGFINFEWLGANAPETVQNIVYTPAVPASRNFRPTEGSTAYWWHSDQSSAEELFEVNMVVAVNFYLDVELEFVLKMDTNMDSLSTLTGATANAIVYPSLPTSLSAGARMIPVGLPTG